MLLTPFVFPKSVNLRIKGHSTFSIAGQLERSGAVGRKDLKRLLMSVNKSSVADLGTPTLQNQATNIEDAVNFHSSIKRPVRHQD